MSRKNMKLLFVLIVLVLIVSIGKETYALFTSNINSTVQKYSTGTLNLSYSNASINLTNTYPMSDTEGMSMDNISITITNTGTLTYKFDVILNPSSGSTLGTSLIKVSIDNNTPALLSTNSNTIIEDVILNPGASRTFTLRTWIVDTASSTEVLGKIFKADIVSEGIAVKSMNNSNGVVLAG